MRVLLDECLPRKLKLELSGHEVKTVSEMGWASKRNSALLALAADRFDVFLTVDQNIAYQQNLKDLRLRAVMSCRSVGYHPAAFAEGAADWYRERSPQAEAAFLAEIEQEVREIALGPERWPSYLQGSRRYLLHRFPFSVVYRQRAGKIQIVAVAHAHRRPGYRLELWSRRPVQTTR